MHWQRESIANRHLEIRLGKSGYHQHSCDGQFGSSSLFDLVGAYMQNKSGARIEPLGTPHVMDAH